MHISLFWSGTPENVPGRLEINHTYSKVNIPQKSKDNQT